MTPQDVRAYIDVIDTFVPQLVELGYDVGDFNDTIAAIHVEGFGIRTYVPIADVDQLESLVDPVLHQQRVAALETPFPDWPEDAEKG